MSEVDNIPQKSEAVFTVSVTFLVFAILTWITYRLFQFQSSQFPITFMFYTVLGFAGGVLFCQNIRVTYDCSRLQFFWLTIMVGLVLLTLVALVFIGSGYINFNRQIHFISMVIWAPAMEEAFYRLFLLNVFQRMTGRNLDALLASSFIFMAIHILSYYAAPLALTMTFLTSLLMGILFLATRQLWPAITVHFLWNFFAFIFENLNFSLSLYGWLLIPLLPILIILGIYTIIKLLRDNELLSVRKFLAWLWNPTEPTPHKSVAVVLGLVSVLFTFQFIFPISLGAVNFSLLAWTGLPWFISSSTVLFAPPIITLILVFTFGLAFVALLVNTIQSWKTSMKSNPD